MKRSNSMEHGEKLVDGIPIKYLCQPCPECEAKLEAAKEMEKALTAIAAMRFKGKKLECSYFAEEALSVWEDLKK